MTPRRNRPRSRRPPADEPEEPRVPEIVVGAPPGWQVRAVQPARAVKTYRCPGCDQEIMPRTAHVVAWREHEPDLRRHWHRPCWQREARMR